MRVAARQYLQIVNFLQVLMESLEKRRHYPFLSDKLNYP